MGRGSSTRGSRQAYHGQPLGKLGWPRIHRSDPIEPPGITYFVLAPDYAAGVPFDFPAGYSTVDSLKSTSYFLEHGPRLSYVTTQVHCPMRNTFLMCDASCQDHRDLVSLLYIHVRHEIEVGIPSTMHRE